MSEYYKNRLENYFLKKDYYCDIVKCMKYYAVQVRTNQEESFIEKVLSNGNLSDNLPTFIFPKRKLSIRRQGKNIQELKPVFPGYLFVQTEKMEGSLYEVLRKTPGFFRILPNNKEYYPLEGKDLSILQHFMNFGQIIDTSKVIFDENQRIQVKSGPLSGLEGNIIKVDKRKKRAKVKLDFANESFIMDLAFEIIEKSEEK